MITLGTWSITWGRCERVQWPVSSGSRLLSCTIVGDNMIRTQISLDESEYDLTKREAAALGISVAEFIRRAVRQRLPVPGEGAWMKYAGFVATGDPDSSQSIDEIVYGTKD
jgi:hypothetical protein